MVNLREPFCSQRRLFCFLWFLNFAASSCAEAPVEGVADEMSDEISMLQRPSSARHHSLTRGLSRLPGLGLDDRTITAVGHYSGADLTVQLQVAFSSWVSGSCVFAGQPYHCQGTRFPNEPLVDEKDAHSSISWGAMRTATCQDCPSGKTVYHDHCKGWLAPDLKLAQHVDVSMLAAYAKKQASLGNIDPIHNLHNRPIHLWAVAEDRYLMHGSAKKTRDFFLALNASRVVYEEFTGQAHGFPGASGARQCFYSLWPEKVGIWRPHKEENLLMFDQTEFLRSSQTVGMQEAGAVYIPSACRKPRRSGSTGCALQLVIPSCGADWHFAKAHGFLDVAESFNTVMLIPQQGASSHGPAEMGKAKDWSCWDSHGKTGADYAIKSGAQMDAIAKMVQRLTSHFDF